MSRNRYSNIRLVSMRVNLDKIDKVMCLVSLEVQFYVVFAEKNPPKSCLGKIIYTNFYGVW